MERGVLVSRITSPYPGEPFLERVRHIHERARLFEEDTERGRLTALQPPS